MAGKSDKAQYKDRDIIKSRENSQNCALIGSEGVGKSKALETGEGAGEGGCEPWRGRRQRCGRG